MNAVFTFICITSLTIMLFNCPQSVLPAMLSGGEKAINLIIAIIPSYALWMGFFSLLEASGISQKLAKFLKKPIQLLIGKTDESTNQLISLNLSANLIGISGIATPAGISACENLDKQNSFKALSLFFVLAASGLQLLPTAIISLRTRYLSINPTDIILPIFLSALFTAIIGILLVKIFIKK